MHRGVIPVAATSSEAFPGSSGVIIGVRAGEWNGGVEILRCSADVVEYLSIEGGSRNADDDSARRCDAFDPSSPCEFGYEARSWL